MKKLLALIILLFPMQAFAIGNPSGSVQSTVAEATRVLKSSGGSLISFLATSGAAAGYVLFFDATAAPANGTVTPKLCYILPANTTLSGNFQTIPLPFNTGIVMEFSSTGCFTATSSATAFLVGQAQ
jgi:hypothetical protein